MTTKEEKARLVAIAGILRETAEELALICGVEVEKQKEFIAAKVKKEKPEHRIWTQPGKPTEPKDGEVKGPMKIGDLNIGDEGIIIEAEILDVERKTGNTKKGEAYEKLSVMLSDKSGPIKLVLWNEQVEAFGNLQPNDVIRVNAWKVEKGYKGGVFELVYGKFGSIEQIKHGIERHIL